MSAASVNWNTSGLVRALHPLRTQTPDFIHRRCLVCGDRWNCRKEVTSLIQHVINISWEFWWRPGDLKELWPLSELVAIFGLKQLCFFKWFFQDIFWNFFFLLIKLKFAVCSNETPWIYANICSQDGFYPEGRINCAAAAVIKNDILCENKKNKKNPQGILIVFCNVTVLENSLIVSFAKKKKSLNCSV